MSSERSRRLEPQDGMGENCSGVTGDIIIIQHDVYVSCCLCPITTSVVVAAGDRRERHGEPRRRRRRRLRRVHQWRQVSDGDVYVEFINGDM